MSLSDDIGSAVARQEYFDKLPKRAKPPTPPNGGKPPTSPPDDDDGEVDSNFDPLDSNKVYTPKTLQQSLRIGRNVYENLLAEGLPCSRFSGRYFFVGRLVIEFFEKRTTQHERAKKGKGPTR